LKACGWGDS